MEWISVKESMPEAPSRVLIYYGDVSVANWHGWNFYISSNYPATKVTHWMPLPSPPKEDTC